MRLPCVIRESERRRLAFERFFAYPVSFPRRGENGSGVGVDWEFD